MLRSIVYDGEKNTLSLIDQTKLPLVCEYVDIADTNDGWTAIRTMQVRGAPAIAITAALSLAVEVTHKIRSSESDSTSTKSAHQFVLDRLAHLRTSRPTAVNLFEAADRIEAAVATVVALEGKSARDVFERVVHEAQALLSEDTSINKAIGSAGVSALMARHRSKEDGASDQGISVLTHCNTGSLATSGYGTALGVIRALHHSKCLKHAYCTETRPYNQGSRLTALELMHDEIPSTLIVDSMAAALMATRSIGAVIVGADRVAANGDTANKIGTYQLAVVAAHHRVPFYVAAPITTLDLSCKSGDAIEIEQRSPDEIRSFKGIPIAPKDMNCWNPAFDVTPHALITGIITELGEISPNPTTGEYQIEEFLKSKGWTKGSTAHLL